MGECEICGAEGADYLALIEGARMRVCADCAAGGQLLQGPPKPVQRPAAGLQSTGRQKSEVDVVPDFGAKIKNAREKMHLERKVLAEMISEKESIIERLEHEKMLPPETVALKLQKALGIVLLEQVGTGGGSYSKDVKKGLTLGDIVFVKKKG
ncbi:MAG: multiprotein bridging factor aMBF1, partial [Candidatus Micrarchaeia archaeon]